MKVINPVGDDTLLVRYKITRSIRYCSWSNLCPVSCSVGRRGPAITDTKRTIIVRRLIQSVVSVISRVWFIWDRTRGRITRIPRSHHAERERKTSRNLLPRVPRVIAIFISVTKFLLTREREKYGEEWKSDGKCALFSKRKERSMGGNRSVERIADTSKGMVER